MICYISPNVTMNEFLEALDELEEEIRTLKRRNRRLQFLVHSLGL